MSHSLAQHLACSRSSAHVCWMNKWMLKQMNEGMHLNSVSEDLLALDHKVGKWGTPWKTKIEFAFKMAIPSRSDTQNWKWSRCQSRTRCIYRSITMECIKEQCLSEKGSRLFGILIDFISDTIGNGYKKMQTILNVFLNMWMTMKFLIKSQTLRWTERKL